jgi:transposase
MSKLNHTDTPASAEYATVYVAFELSKAKWHLGVILPGSQKLSRFRIDGGDLAALSTHLATWRAKAAGSGKPVQIISCYEAGYDGHWLHRWLTSQGVINYVMDPASIQVSRQARRPKTDRIDLDQLMNTLLRYLRGEPRACSIVRVPSPEDEDRRRVSRERDRLLKERAGHTNRITGLLHAQGIRDAKPLARGFMVSLGNMRTADGRPLPPKLKEEIVREHQRLSLVHQQLLALEKKSRAELRAPARDSVEQRINNLIDFRGIGVVGGRKLMHEAFYRSFDNRRQVGSFFGLTNSAYDSGNSHRDQGISKAGNRRARALSIELAWMWLRYQPESELSRWFRARVGHQKGRIKRIAIVALARKLMVALWRYVTTGLVPTGAVLPARKAA